MAAKELASELIKFFEGCELEAYLCPARIWTIGVGSTKGVHEGMVITEEEATQRLYEDMHDSQKRIDRLVKIKLAPHEHAALLSLGFNVSYNSSIKLAGYLNGDKELFKKKLLLYCKGGGKVLKGLKIRRIAERLLFEERPWKDIATKMQKMSIEEIEDYSHKLFAGV